MVESGRHKRLKISRGKSRAGSSPAERTTNPLAEPNALLQRLKKANRVKNNNDIIPPPKIGVRQCRCGHIGCKTYVLTGIGIFYAGSGFEKEQAELIAGLLNNYYAKIIWRKKKQCGS